jgi:hypothetical protein
MTAIAEPLVDIDWVALERQMEIAQLESWLNEPEVEWLGLTEEPLPSTANWLDAQTPLPEPEPQPIYAAPPSAGVEAMTAPVEKGYFVPDTKPTAVIPTRKEVKEILATGEIERVKLPSYIDEYLARDIPQETIDHMEAHMAELARPLTDPNWKAPTE